MDFPRWFGGAIASITVRNKLEQERQDGGKLKQSEVGSDKSKQWASARGQQSKMNLGGADAALRNKFPGLMKD